uniref:Protein kinase domain-containing protein n=1 Tax=Macrostomum lignano TaxID=282301 RepID=A0A1I8FA43_9PLAT
MSERSSSAYLRIKLSGTSWTKEKEIGHGCFGKSLPRVKLEASSMDQMHSLAERVAKELAILESVTGSHKNIVRYYGFSISVRSRSRFTFSCSTSRDRLWTPTLKAWPERCPENEIARHHSPAAVRPSLCRTPKGIVHRIRTTYSSGRATTVVKLIDFRHRWICGHKRDSIVPIAYSAPRDHRREPPAEHKVRQLLPRPHCVLHGHEESPADERWRAEALMLALMPMMLAIKMRSQEPLPDMDSSKFSSA